MVVLSLLDTTDARWLQVAVPATAVVSSYLLYTYRGWLVHCLYKAIAKCRGARTGLTYLSGNFAPVQDEIYEENALIESGAIPAGLEGVFLRNGPNPMFTPMHGYHWFDGDGMLHAVRIKGGKASYCNHFVQTAKLEQEKAAKSALFMKMGDMSGRLGLALTMLDVLRKRFGFLDMRNGSGTANTALTFHAKRILALHEGDLPYEVRVLCNGLVETVGRLKMFGTEEWKGNSFTAHPKLDTKTGELLFFNYSFDSAPYVRAGLLDKHGLLQKTWDVDVAYPTMMHDMAATANYVVMLHLPLVFDPKVMVEKDSLPLVFNNQLPGRIGLIRRDAPSSAPGSPTKVQWFELPSFFTFHVANAFEDSEGRVKIYACHFEEFHFGGMENDDNLPEGQQQRLYEYCLNPKTGEATTRKISDVVGDFPVVHPSLACHKTRYTWMGRMTKTAGNPVAFTGISKIDMDTAKGKDGCVGSISYPEGCYGGEAMFVPKHQNPSPAQEDEGWLLSFVYHSGKDASKLHIYDAKTMAQEPLAVLRMPRRVPFGFHGMFVNEEQFAQQRTLKM